MKLLLNILLLIAGIADAVTFFQLRKCINGFEDHLDNSLPDDEILFVEKHVKRLQVLSTIVCALFLIRFVICDLLPLFQG